MTRISPEIWFRLATAPPIGPALRAARALPDISHRLLAALDASGQRHLLIALEGSDVPLDDTRSRGLEIVTRPLALAGDTDRTYIDVMCRDPGGHEIFDMIGGEIALALAAGRQSPGSVIDHVLARWRRFWSRAPGEVLSREAALGLFSELWFLTFWLVPQAGASRAVASWRGPLGSRHDFEWSGTSVEVKSTAAVRDYVHRIHGLEQLAPPETGRLLLFSLRLREEGGASNTLPAAVEQARRISEHDLVALEHLERVLAAAGYTDTHQEAYADMRLRVVEQSLYEVSDGFPRLTAGSFTTPLPAGIRGIDYDIEMSAATRFRIARGPSDPGASLLARTAN